jgi:CPA2 family monovalent cation:H+ antiporter-2
MVLTPFLSSTGAAWAGTIERGMAAGELARTPAEPEALPGHLSALEDHVIVAGYGDAARRLVRVLAGSNVPFLITTLSPGGAIEAESEGLPVLRGDSTRQRTLQIAGIERAKMLVIPDDDPGTAHRITSVARTLSPTLRIVVRTRYAHEAHHLERGGASLVIAEELEGVVALFGEVLRDFAVPAAEIEAHEEAVRRGGYAALRDENPAPPPHVECDLEAAHAMRPAAPAPAPVPALAVAAVGGASPAPVASAPGARAFSTPASRAIDLETSLTLGASGGASRCQHVDAVRPVRPRTRGCEECLRSGSRWVHLRLCMTCGHVGCCDSSPHRHATAHWKTTGHPIMRSLEPGETWGWCYPDETEL